MLEQNVMIGMKVVAHAKTVPTYTKRSDFMNGEPYLYVNHVDKVISKRNGKTVFVLSNHMNNNTGNYFFAEDFEPIELTKPKEIQKWLMHNHINPCAEVTLPGGITNVIG